MRNHLPELDGIRGIAILVVILHHLAQAFPPQHGALGVWLAVTKAGWLGVDIFFALSGFLITRGLLVATEERDYYQRFYIKRFFRLAPLYLMTLVLIGLIVPHSGPFIGLSLVYLANFAKPLGIVMAYGPLWSLSVEEHFYFVWPSLVKHLSRKTLLVVVLLLCLATPIARLVAYHHGWFDPYVTWFRVDGLAWGALVAVLSCFLPRSSGAVVATCLLFGGAGLFFLCAVSGGMGRSSFLGSVMVYGVVALTTSGLIYYSILNPGTQILSVLRLRSLTFLGEISYWLYLFHVLIVGMVALPILRHLAGLAAYSTLLCVVFGLSIITGIAVRDVIERPSASLRNRLLGGRQERLCETMG